jgi:hypothetical protein
LSRRWKEAQEKRISLPEIDPETLEGYLNWIYTRRVKLQLNTPPCGSCKDIEYAPNNCLHSHSLGLVVMYTLGDYLKDLQFCNAVVDQMVAMKTSEWSPCALSADAVGWVWKHTASDSPLRNFCLELHKGCIPHEGTRSYFESQMSKLPKSFMIDLLVLIGKKHRKSIEQDYQRSEANDFVFSEKCRFHKHTDNSDKCG